MGIRTTKTVPLHLTPLGMDADSIRHAIVRHLVYTLGKEPETATPRDWLHALVMTLRERLIERSMATMRRHEQQGTRRVYYLSIEFLVGRSLGNVLHNLGIEAAVADALADLGQDPAALARLEDEAALGNGGLGRLAACILDSIASLDMPGYGYGIRYEYGMFNQRIENGWQVEHPENWLRYGHPWEIPRPEVIYPVRFYGREAVFTDASGRQQHRWVDTELVMAMAYDVPVPGHGTETVNNLRLWTAKSTREFELAEFNLGNYIRALEYKITSENLSRVLYPNDSVAMNRELRLKQEYFFVSAAMQDILQRFEREHGDLDRLPEKVAIQLNDTHPALAVAELMRVLVDDKGRDWGWAWDITQAVCSYTNHTLLPEALESWPVALMARVLPRHLSIVYEINRRFLDQVAHRYPSDPARLRRLSLVDEEGVRRVRMAHLAIVGSAHVNGVSALHTRLLKADLFADFQDFFPQRFVNVTNGITPRRWLAQANPALATLLDDYIGKGWRTNLDQLCELEPWAEDAQFCADFRAVKHQNKQWLNRVIQWRTRIDLDPAALYDVQVKRIHEYKRQLLCLLHVITLYNRCRILGPGLAIPRTVIFAGKAAPGYTLAKQIIKLINDVADRINRDPATNAQLRMVFIPNYDVTTAMDVIPAADLSEQISTAGFEASGTGNMKFAINGALTIGTLDGANIEIRERVGVDNFFLFGLDAHEVASLKLRGHDPHTIYLANPELREAVDQIRDGFFSPGDRRRHRSIADYLERRDPFLVLADFADYVRVQRDAETLFADPGDWTRRSVLTVARMGYFSSDRTVRDYAQRIWGI